MSFERMLRPRPISLPLNRISPAVASIRPTTARPIVVLPEPDSPTSAKVSPDVDREVDTVDRLNNFARTDDRKLLHQILHFKQRGHAAAVSTGKWQRT